MCAFHPSMELATVRRSSSTSLGEMIRHRYLVTCLGIFGSPVLGPSNFVLGRSFPLYGVFRKHWRVAQLVRPVRLAIHHLRRFRGVADWPAPTTEASASGLRRLVP